jgi:hypothetical protein
MGAEPLACGLDRRLDVANALVLVELPHQSERELELSGHIGIKLHARLDPPEEVGREREIAKACPMVALTADALIDPENLLDHDHRGRGRAVRFRDIGLEAAVMVQRLDLDHHSNQPSACSCFNSQALVAGPSPAE